MPHPLKNSGRTLPRIIAATPDSAKAALAAAAAMTSAMALGILIMSFAPARATPAEGSYVSSLTRATTPIYAGRVTPDAIAADMAFITGMEPHHAGALTMSEEYLASPDANHALLKQLARGIIHNQTFEIGMLQMVHRQHGIENGPVALRGQAQSQRFFRAPIPGPLDGWGRPRTASLRDVQFAKAMIVHHQGALDMARDYLRDPNARNHYLRQMSFDIILDQQLEIDFMNAIIKTYPGDPDTVKIDASMIHGMDHMNHGGHQAHKPAPATKKQEHKSHAPHQHHH